MWEGAFETKEKDSALELRRTKRLRAGRLCCKRSRASVEPLGNKVESIVNSTGAATRGLIGGLSSRDRGPETTFISPTGVTCTSCGRLGHSARARLRGAYDNDTYRPGS
jgi:hypothetical protein